MAFDEKLARRVSEYFMTQPGGSEKKMFGGVCYLLHGNMCAGVVGDKLMLRVGTEAYADLLKNKQVEPMTFTGKPLKGMVYVLPAGTRTKPALVGWLEAAVHFAKALPAKIKPPKLRKRN